MKMTPKQRVQAELQARSTALGSVEKMVNGDHFQNGAGWNGPGLSSNDDGYNVYQQRLKDKFTSRNLLAEVCSRHADAVTSIEASWSLVPRRELGTVDVTETPGGAATPATSSQRDTATSNEQALIDEATAALTTWWDGSGVWQAVQQAAETLQWAALKPRLAVAALRAYIARSAVIAGQVPTAPLAEVMAAIRIAHHSPLACGVARDSDGMATLGFFAYQDDEQNNVLELLERGSSDDVVLTIDTQGKAQTIVYPIKTLPIVEITTARPLITQQAKEQQRLVNKTLTMLSLNLDGAGMVERVISNAQLAGSWVNASGEEVTEDVAGARFVPAATAVGPGTMTAFQGLPIMGPDGSVAGYTTPNVQRFEPISTATFTEASALQLSVFYAEVKQAHMLIAGDATASGVSRQQAVADFKASVGITAKAVEKALRELLMLVLRWGAYLEAPDNPTAWGRFDRLLRVQVECRLSTSQPTSEDNNDTRASYDKGLLSQETAMNRIGVEDPAAELARIAAEKAAAPPQPLPQLAQQQVQPTDPNGQQQQASQGQP
jgi:hypothetical protein